MSVLKLVEAVYRMADEEEEKVRGRRRAKVRSRTCERKRSSRISKS